LAQVLGMKPNPFYAWLGARVRARRRELGLSQWQLAQALDLERTSITNLEKGVQRISAEALVQLARTLNLPPADLLPPEEPSRDVSQLLSAKAPRPVRAWIERTVAPPLGGRKNATSKKTAD